jgi:hypothetical protein
VWRRLVPWLFAPGGRPGPVARVLNHVAVTPLAHVTMFNVDYQLYLSQILHTSVVAWVGHMIFIPINVALLLYALAFHFGTSASLAIAGLFAGWYVGMAIKFRSGLWALVSIAALTSLVLLANIGAQLVGEHAIVPWYLRPLPLMVAGAAMQAHTHLFEAHVPPRANFQQHWLPLRDFLWGDPSRRSLGRRLRHLAWTPLGAVWGTLDEWWASPKLLPLYLLELMWALGYRPAQRQELHQRAIEALASGDPALDWVGVGGGASIAVLAERGESSA